jgi:hypothetical protein
MGASLPTRIKAFFSVMVISQFISTKNLRLHHQLGRLCLPCFGILKEYVCIRVGHEAGPCTATFNDLLCFSQGVLLAHFQKCGEKLNSAS